MNISDPISDMLTRIRNAFKALHKDVLIPHSKIKVAMAAILKDEGYIDEFAVEGNALRVTLKYHRGKPVVAGLKRVSTPGRRVYVAAAEIPRVQNGLGICILSTNKGLLAGDAARSQHLGGELLCEVW